MKQYYVNNKFQHYTIITIKFDFTPFKAPIHTSFRCRRRFHNEEVIEILLVPKILQLCQDSTKQVMWLTDQHQ